MLSLIIFAPIPLCACVCFNPIREGAVRAWGAFRFILYGFSYVPCFLFLIHNDFLYGNVILTDIQ